MVGTANILQMYAKMEEGDISLALRMKRMKTVGSLTVETVHICAQLMHRQPVKNSIYHGTLCTLMHWKTDD